MCQKFYLQINTSENYTIPFSALFSAVGTQRSPSVQVIPTVPQVRRSIAPMTVPPLSLPVFQASRDCLVLDANITIFSASLCFRYADITIFSVSFCFLLRGPMPPT